MSDKGDWPPHGFDFEQSNEISSARGPPSPRPRVPLPPRRRQSAAEEIPADADPDAAQGQSPKPAPSLKDIQERYVRRMNASRPSALRHSVGPLQGINMSKAGLGETMPMPTLRLMSLTPTSSREFLNLNEVEARPRKLSEMESGRSNDQHVVRIEVGDFDAAMAQVSDEIFEQRTSNFTGLMLFMIRGEASLAELEQYKGRISAIITENGYAPRLKSNHPNIVYFRMVRAPQQRRHSYANPEAGMKMRDGDKQSVILPSMSAERALMMAKMQLRLNFKGVTEFVPEGGKYHEILMSNFPVRLVELCQQMGYVARIVDERRQVVEASLPPVSPVEPKAEPQQRITVQLPSFDAETADNLIKSQLESDYEGIVVFKAEKKFFSKSQMKNYPKRILDLCKEYGYRARVVDAVTNTVECEMTGDGHKPVVYYVPLDDRKVIATLNKSLESDSAAILKPLSGEFSPPLEKLIIDTCRDHGKVAIRTADKCIQWSTPKPHDPHRIVVPISTFDKAAAESLIRTHLESDFSGVIVFKPAHGGYSSTLMSEYPKKITDICREYGFDAKVMGNQCVECSKTGQKKEDVTIKLPCYDQKEAEAWIMKELLSGVRRTVTFTPFFGTYSESMTTNFPQRIVEICQSFGYEASVTNVEKQTVQCVMKPVPIDLPVGDTSGSLEAMVRKEIRSDTKAVYAFKPELKIKEDNELRRFKERVMRACTECGCTPYDSNNDKQFVFCNTASVKTAPAGAPAPAPAPAPKEAPPPSPKSPAPGGRQSVTVALPTFDPKIAESLVRAQLVSDFVGTVRFQPKSYKYSETMMKGWPQRILEIIREYGFRGRLVNETSQLVECEMNDRFSSKRT